MVNMQEDFTKELRRHQERPRVMPWRENLDPYWILVSEIMLQQTQVSRVEPKFREFVAKFPDIETLAKADLADVLVAWNGLGYNRRAKFLWQSAQMICESFGGEVPREISQLIQLPGVGENTAGAIAAYAFNEPAIFIETNVRTVILHNFFADRDGVTDAEIREKLNTIINRDHPRAFYWAIMDYGTELKSTLGNVSRRAKSYAKQSKFDGSDRQIRGHILRILGEKSLAKTELSQEIGDPRFDKIMADLLCENLIHEKQGKIRLGTA